MKVRILCIVTATLAAMACTAVCRADCLACFCHSVAQDFKRRNCWPQPFVCPDRQAVRAPFVTMVANGWQLQNTLGGQHFQEGASQLTEAGRLKVRWIVTEAPEQHRIVYVHSGADAQETTARMEAVHKLLAEIAPGRDSPPVVETSVASPGWPAERVDIIGRKFNSTTPAPRLPQNQNNGSGGSGSGPN